MRTATDRRGVFTLRLTPKVKTITWTLSGPDMDDFDIDGGVVTLFKNAPRLSRNRPIRGRTPT